MFDAAGLRGTMNANLDRSGGSSGIVLSMPSPTSDASSRPGKAFRPRFRLATLLVFVTLAAVGSWYWWRRPFEVEHEGLNGEVVREVETVRRLWGGKTIRSGPVVGYDNRGRKIAESHYREGVLHGRSTTWFGDGRIREEGEYADGKKEGPWIRYSRQRAKSVASWSQGVPDDIWEWYDVMGKRRYEARFASGRLVVPLPQEFEGGLAQCLMDGRIGDANVVLMLLSPSEMEFVETPLKDAIDYLAKKHETGIVLDAKPPVWSGVRAIPGRLWPRETEG